LRLFFPNAFTPNQDGLNDTFQPKALFIREFKMTVYTRNGRQLFSTEDINQGWDGTFGQEPLPPDTYIYTAEAADFSGERISTRGTFVLIR
jgi:gliding motility-associated-like protein